MLRKWYQNKRYAKSVHKSKKPSSSTIDANENTFENKTELGSVQKDLEANAESLHSVFQNSIDVVFHPFSTGNGRKAMLVYIENMCNKEEIDKNILTPLIYKQEDFSHEEDLSFLPIAKRTPQCNLNDCVKSILMGEPALFIDGFNQGTTFGLQKWEQRGVIEPEAQTVIRGPREGFIENVAVNMTLIRKKIHSPYLKFESFRIGTFTQTNVVLCYIEGIVDPSLVEEAKCRLDKINIDGVLESGYIQEFLEDNWMSPFPQMLETERPDMVCAQLLEGRVAIMVDGTPFVLVAPISYFSLIQAPEDHYNRWLYATPILWLRLALVVITLLLPSIYVALVTFHQEMIPTSLVISIASLREAVPFPALVEALLLEFMFEALREAGIRLPKQMGSAVSIVGALVIGEAAVRAGIISSPMVIIVATTGVASFAIPTHSLGLAFRLLRFPFILLAGSLGFLGIMFGIIVLSIHLCSLRSFGVPYLSPAAPLQTKDLKDTAMRVPWWMMRTRPGLTGEQNSIRQEKNQKPHVLNPGGNKKGEV